MLSDISLVAIHEAAAWSVRTLVLQWRSVVLLLQVGVFGKRIGSRSSTEWIVLLRRLQQWGCCCITRAVRGGRS